MRWLIKYNCPKQDPNLYKEKIMLGSSQARVCEQFTKENPGCFIKGFPRPVGGGTDIEAPPK